MRIRSLQREHVGVLDAEDVPALRAALGEMARRLDPQAPGPAADETEVQYRGGSLRVALVLGKGPSRKPTLALRVEPAGASALFDTGGARPARRAARAGPEPLRGAPPPALS